MLLDNGKYLMDHNILIPNFDTRYNLIQRIILIQPNSHLRSLINTNHLLRNNKRHFNMIYQFRIPIKHGFHQTQPLNNINSLNLIQPSFHLLNPDNKHFLILINYLMIINNNNIFWITWWSLLIYMDIWLYCWLWVTDMVLLELDVC